MTLKTWCYFVGSMVLWTLISLKAVEIIAPTLGVLLPTIIMSIILITMIIGIICWQDWQQNNANRGKKQV